jgi:hypothetical protein
MTSTRWREALRHVAAWQGEHLWRCVRGAARARAQQRFARARSRVNVG